MIACLGDVHNKLAAAAAVLATVPPGVPRLQVGDWGMQPIAMMPAGYAWPVLDAPLHVLPGNHDYWPWFLGREAPYEIAPNIILLPKSGVIELDGRRVAFLGGGDSRDGWQRTEGVDWFAAETISYADQMRLADVGAVDLFVTHVPPQSVLPPPFLYTQEPSSRAVDVVWEALGYPPLVCGHLHIDATWPGPTPAAGPVHVLGELSLRYV